MPAQDQHASSTPPDPSQLRLFLQDSGMTKHEDKFVQHGITFPMLLEMGEAELKAVGIAKGPRVKLRNGALSCRSCVAAF